jgi:cold shock CspA family protein/ribosome-associated translation inhibitor RaiA
MQKPLELIYDDVPRSPWSEDLIRERVARLARYCDHITSALVIVAQPHRHQHKGNPFRVSVEVRVPRNRPLVIIEEPRVVEQRSNLQAVINRAFDAMELRLQGLGEERRRDALRPAEGESRGLVTRLPPGLGYGSLRMPDGREVYFHENAVLHGDFPRLAVGTEVRFEPNEGEIGLTASSVQIVNKPGERESEATRDREDVPPGWRNTPE